MLNPGDIIKGSYEVIRTAGGGSFGTVYLVRDVSASGGRLAIKEMVETDIPVCEQKEAVELFAREAGILGNLKHRGLPMVYEHFSVGSSHYIVMEYIDGETLEEKLKSRSGPFSCEEVLPWADELCSILDYLHNREPEPLIFRDLKPSNIMISKDGELKLIDFGIARHFSPKKVRDTYFMGTPGFSPPEQYGRGQSDERSDIFSFGATLYRLLTKADMEQYSMKLPPLRSLTPSVPEWLESVIMKCLAANPGERYQNFVSLQIDIRAEEYGVHQEKMAPQGLSAVQPQPACTQMSSRQSNSFFYVGIGSTIIVALIFYGVYCYLFNCSTHEIISDLTVFVFVMLSIVTGSIAVIWLFKKWRWMYPAIVISVLAVIAFVTPCLHPRNDCGLLTACKSNLKDIGTAMEMYSSDNEGRYPQSLGALTPQYLKTIPTCASARKMTYRYVFAVKPDCYTVWCHGSHHLPITTVNMPEYDAIRGLYEK